MNKTRLDQFLAQSGLVNSRSQAESYIRLGYVFVDGKQINKPGTFVNPAQNIELKVTEQYVSRAALKLASVSSTLNIVFKDKTVLDVGSSTGGFTDYALKRGAKAVIAVDVGTNQLHPSLQANPRIELQENTDIRDLEALSWVPDIVLIDVSFISIREILPHLLKLISKETHVLAMLKPQFEAGSKDLHKGVIKNDKLRRQILKDFEDWVKKKYLIIDKADSQVPGAKGNHERFYLLKPL